MALDPDEQQVEYWADYIANGGDVSKVPTEMRNAVVAYNASGNWLDDDTEGFEDFDIEGAKVDPGYLAGRGMEAGQGLDAVRGGEAGDTVTGMGTFTDMELQGNVGEFPGLHWRPEADIHSDAFNRFLTYLETFTQDITKKFWERSVLPPLRQAIGKIFTNEGYGEWPAAKEEWYAYKLNPPKQAQSIGGVTASRFKQIGLRTLDYRGTYRNTLVRRSGLNERGNIFRSTNPISQAEEADSAMFARFSGRTKSQGWHLGFEYGIDQEWFQRENKKRRGDDFEAQYPSSFDQDTDKPFFYTPVLKKNAPKKLKNMSLSDAISSLSKGDYARYVRRVFLTGREAVKIEAQNQMIEQKNEQIRAENRKRGQNRPRDMFGHFSSDVEYTEELVETPVIDSQGTVFQRPLWEFFRTERPVVTHFKNRVHENLIKEIVQFLDEGERVHWFGARGSSGQLLTTGDRHLMQLDLYGDVGAAEKLPKSLQGPFRAAQSSQQRREVSDMMFEYRELRSKGNTLSAGERADMLGLESTLESIRRAGEAADTPADDDFIPF